ncbi:hypothetical protein RUND412_002885 [Rhizina undulata]
MFRSAITNSQVNNNNNLVIDSGNTLNIRKVVLNGVQGRVVNEKLNELVKTNSDKERSKILKWIFKPELARRRWR